MTGGVAANFRADDFQTAGRADICARSGKQLKAAVA
jgi:hypothetical protein